jgi:Leucine Rich repeat
MNEGPLPSVATHNECVERSRRTSALWPWIVFLLFTFLFDASLSAVLASDLFLWCSARGVVYPVVALFCGAICGQWLLVMVICGLWGRTWISGYAAAAVLLVTAVSVATLGSVATEGVFGSNMPFTFTPFLFSIAGFLSGILLSSAGIIALRILRGWRLTRRHNQTISTIGITDLIIGTALAALLMIIGNDVETYAVVAAQSLWEPVVTLGIAACVLGLTAVSPIVWLVFRDTRLRLLKLIVTIVVNCLICGLLGAAISAVSETLIEPFTIVALGALWGLVACSYLITGLILLRVAGFHLYTGKQEAAVPIVAESRVQKLAVPGTMLATLLLVHLLLMLAAIYEANRESKFRQSQRDFADLGGELIRDDGDEAKEAKLWPDATRDDLMQLLTYPKLGAISLADSAILDRDLDSFAQFNNLNILDLSGTAITDQGLEKLANCKTLSRLSLARTKCTAAGIARLLDKAQIFGLDLSALNLDDEGLREIVNCSNAPTQSYVLSRNPLTNAGIAILLEKFPDYGLSIDLTDCQVDERCLTSIYYTELILDGTQITEAGFASKLATLVVNETLSMDRTAVTDNILPKLAAASIGKLKLGETRITEEALGQLGTSSCTELSLNSIKFTGVCFSNWKPSIQTLDMSHSGVTDATIAHIVKLPALYQLVLRDTVITDASLALLAESNLQTIDLCDTQITAAGLAKHEWDYKELKVTAAQFSEAEFKILLPLAEFKIQSPKPSKKGISSQNY